MLGPAVPLAPSPNVADDQSMPSTPFPDDAHTTLRPSGGIENWPSRPPSSKVNRINPALPFPARSGLRYDLSPKLLGKLEKLAKARFEIGELTNTDLKTWRTDTEEPYWPIAQSVNASSEIEGEQIAADKLTLLFAAATEPSAAYIDDELGRRMEAIRSIYSTYLWALTSDRSNLITFEFVTEVHQRMFVNTQPHLAGKLKQKAVYIRGAGYEVETLPPDRTADFLRALCERTNERWKAARNYGEYSMFLCTAEFLLDFLAIHPFTDGNGRTARLLSTFLLERSGYHFSRFYPLDNIILETRDSYYHALFSAQRHWYTSEEDLTAWILYYVDSVFIQWSRAFQRVRDQRGQDQSIGHAPIADTCEQASSETN